MNAYTLIGLAALLLGCAAFYLASPNQRWRAAPIASRPARAVGGLLLVLGWLALAQDMLPLTASFVFATFLMLVFSVLPYVGALLNVRRRAAK
ncbi:hypothetical protein [Achromobacter denitrificans]|uniref:hypothetical protein n=1 Tax=Achromobacter denitrificans TaxID=32002 RepID=UPI00242A56B1|nr:hypothetical protein [Achromobacter denitrificans]MBV2160524.1 hypothetical protein [Achromobacter denitrificans]